MSCYKCDLSITRTNVVLGIGNKKAEIMIIGEAPGYHEDKKGVPFIGKSGTYLRELLTKINITEENAYITNVVKCRPPGNREPDMKEISICTSYFLSNEINYVNPIFIISAGRVATMMCTGENISIHKVNGNIYRIGKRWVIPIFHPSYILQNDNMKEEYERTLTKVSNLIYETKNKYLFDIIASFDKVI